MHRWVCTGDISILSHEPCMTNELREEKKQIESVTNPEADMLTPTAPRHETRAGGHSFDFVKVSPPATTSSSTLSCSPQISKSFFGVSSLSVPVIPSVFNLSNVARIPL